MNGIACTFLRLILLCIATSSHYPTAHQLIFQMHTYNNNDDVTLPHTNIYEIHNVQLAALGHIVNAIERIEEVHSK